MAGEMAGEDFAARRKALGLNQDQLAEEFGVHRSAVARWELDTRPILKATVLALEGLEARLRAKARSGKKKVS